MEFWLSYLPIIVYILLIVLLFILIVLGIKTLNIMNKVEVIVDNITEKIEAITPIFNMLDFAADRFSAITTSAVDGFTRFIGKLINRKGKKEEID